MSWIKIKIKPPDLAFSISLHDPPHRWAESLLVLSCLGGGGYLLCNLWIVKVFLKVFFWVGFRFLSCRERERERTFTRWRIKTSEHRSVHTVWGAYRLLPALWILTVQPFHTEVTVCARKTTEPKNKVNLIAATSIPSSRWSLQQFPELPTSSLNVGTKLVLRVTPLEGAWPCGHLDFGLLPSRIVREEISVVLSHPLVVIHHSSPRKLKHLAR